MTKVFPKNRFCSFTPEKQHKEAAHLLRHFIETKNASTISRYRALESWMDLAPCPLDRVALYNRYHHHCTIAGIFHKEHTLLPKSTTDTPTAHPPYPMHIYLDHIRSAHNVGSIIRTCEALRIGSIYFSESMCSINNPKLHKTSMQAHEHIAVTENALLEELPRPWIAIETSGTENAYTFDFPNECTLIFGNEEYGISPLILNKVDHILSIPLRGFKNALNVANTASIILGLISFRKEHPSLVTKP